jgi:hypothetical protein
MSGSSRSITTRRASRHKDLVSVMTTWSGRTGLWDDGIWLLPVPRIVACDAGGRKGDIAQNMLNDSYQLQWIATN